MMFSILNMDFSDRVKSRMQALGLSAIDLATLVGVSKGAVSHWTSGSNLATGKRLIALAEALQCDARWLATGDGTLTQDPEPGSPSSSDYALIPQFTAKGASGNGYLNDHVEVRGGLAFKRDWLSRMGLREHNLRVLYNHGDSNWPTLTDGEVLLIDESQVDPQNGKMFALFNQDGEIMIKRLIRDFSSGWVIRSDNQDKTRYPDMPITDEGMQGVDIIGRVVWRGGGM